jgi:hypothetical protein
VYYSYDIPGPEPHSKVVQHFIDDWNSLAQLYEAVLNFAVQIKGRYLITYSVSLFFTIFFFFRFIFPENNNYGGQLEIRSFNFKRITLAYGPNKCYTVCVTISVFALHAKSSFYRLRFNSWQQRTSFALLLGLLDQALWETATH